MVYFKYLILAYRGQVKSKVMSKKETNKSYPNQTVGYEGGYFVSQYDIQNIEGKILTLIETLGLKDTQEKSTKDIARGFIKELYRCEYIYGNEITEILTKTNRNVLITGGVANNY